MNSNQKSQNTWVTDLNKSVENIKQKEKFNYTLKITSFVIGCAVLVFMVILLGKSKLQVMNPKLSISENIEVETKILPEKVSDTQIETQKVIPKDPIEIKSELITEKKPKQNESQLSKNRPKDSLNSSNEEIVSTSNKRNGKHITYYDNGNKWVELNFVNGLREGIQYTWHRNGQLKSELNYVNAKKHGSQKWWQKDGKILNDKIFVNGEWQKF